MSLKLTFSAVSMVSFQTGTCRLRPQKGTLPKTQTQVYTLRLNILFSEAYRHLLEKKLFSNTGYVIYKRGVNVTVILQRDETSLSCQTRCFSFQGLLYELSNPTKQVAFFARWQRNKFGKLHRSRRWKIACVAAV